MRRRQGAIAMVLALAAAGCVSKLDVRKVEPGRPSKAEGALYRLPVPRVQIEEKKFSKDLDVEDLVPTEGKPPDERVAYVVSLVAVPSDEHVYSVAVEQGWFSKDSATVQLGAGGVLAGYELESSERSGAVIEKLATVVLSVAGLAGARTAFVEGAPPPLVRPPLTATERASILHHRALLAGLRHRLEQLRNEMDADPTTAEVEEYEKLLAKLDKIDKGAHPPADTVRSVELLEIRTLGPGQGFEDALQGLLAGGAPPKFVALARRRNDR